MCYLDTDNKSECFGCEACMQICPKKAISMLEDEEGFRYPVIDKDKCINCNLCRRSCPYSKMPKKYEQEKYTFGGYHKDWKIRNLSTSGGAFSAIVEEYCDENYVIFGATSNGIEVYHTYIEDKQKIEMFRKSKYLQSKIGNAFSDAKTFLQQGKKVLFSGTPCQIAGLRAFLKTVNQENLLTVEVICEGVPSPLFIKKYEDYLKNKYHSQIEKLDYRYTNTHKIGPVKYGKWDFEVMQVVLKNRKTIKRDRWFNPFWNIWLNHLMSRPSCYHCQFTSTQRVADITLGDLWGIHLYCPELYGNNGGASLIICNTKKGIECFKLAKKRLYGHELDFEIALKYQSPLRKSIAYNEKRSEFMKDLINQDVNYMNLCKKWYQKPSFKLLYAKYVWGNRQKILIWNIKNKFRRQEECKKRCLILQLDQFNQVK